MKARPSINLHIEELVLHGFAPGDRQGIGEAVERELTRLFSEQPLPLNLMRQKRLAQMEGGMFQMTVGAQPAVLGAQIAGAVHKGFNQ